MYSHVLAPRNLVAAWLFLMVTAAPVFAQQRIPTSLPSSFSTELPAEPHSPVKHIPPTPEGHVDRGKTYWKEGALVGGLAGAIFGVVVVNDNSLGDSSSRSTLGDNLRGGLIGALPGLVLGGLIGSLFHKH